MPPVAEPPLQPSPASEPAWQAELETVLPRLHGWAHLRLRGQRLDPDDLVQEILMRVVTRIDQFRGGQFGAWVFAIAKNVLLECLRRGRQAARVQLVDGHSSRQLGMQEIPASITALSQRIARGDDVRQLLAAAAGLDDTDQRLVLLCGLEGLVPREVAPQVGLSEEAVAKRWYRLRQRLRSDLLPDA